MRINGTVWSARDIAARIDHTVLAPDATRKDMENACALARAYGFKAVFTNPYWTPLIAELLDGSGIAAGISAAFPLGSLSTDAKVAEVMDAVARVDGKPCAVDMVTNIALLKEGHFDDYTRDIAAVVNAVEGRGIAVFNDVQHLALHLFPQLLFAGVVDGRVQRKSGSLQHSLGTQSVELDPEVFPWGLVVGDVRGDLSGEDHEPLHAPDVVGDGLPFGIVRHKRSHTGEHIVEQEVVSARRPERMGRCTAFHAELEQPQIDEIFVGKYGEYQVFHL